MNVHELMDTAQAMVADDKGLLAMDESHPTCNKRFAQVRIPQTVEARRAYRELLVTTPRLGECISGAILYDETIRQQKKDGTPFVDVLIREGIIPGIKVDLGATEMAGFPVKRSPKVWTDCANASTNMLTSGLVLPSGVRCWPSGRRFPPGGVSRPICRCWLAMLHCVRKPGWSLSSNPKCLWMASIR